VHPPEAEKWRQKAFHVALARGLTEDQAHDAAQEAALAILEAEGRRAEVLGGPLSYRYMRAIVTNTLNDEISALAHRKICVHVDLAASEDPDGSSYVAELGGWVDRWVGDRLFGRGRQFGRNVDPTGAIIAAQILEGLSEMDQRIVRLTAEGCSSVEIAEELGCSDTRVRQRLTRLRRRARALFPD